MPVKLSMSNKWLYLCIFAAEDLYITSLMTLFVSHKISINTYVCDQTCIQFSTLKIHNPACT